MFQGVLRIIKGFEGLTEKGQAAVDALLAAPTPEIEVVIGL